MALNIIFMGTPNFAVPILKKLKESQHNIVAVYTQPPKKKNRGQKINFTPIHIYSDQNKIKIRSPDKLDSEEEFQLIKKLRPDVEIKEIRGNVGTRINKLKSGEFDAIILAHAGLKRLKINEHFEKIDIKKMIPSPGQGVIAIVIRENDNLLNFLENLNDKKTLIESECERNFLSALDGSCKTPIGALARLEVKAKSKILFHYMVASEDGEKFIKDKTYFEIDNYCKMSFDLGQKIKKML